MHILHLTNTLSRRKEVLATTQKKISLYVCGITPYDYAHLGHGRCYIVFDVLFRLLTNLGYDVTYCRNFTDVDDKLLNKAQEQLGDASCFSEIAERFIKAYTEDMQQLNCIRPTFEPKVTEHIPEIIIFIQGLIDVGHAYIVDNDVYFSIDSDTDYGKLSHRHLDELQAGARVIISEKKKNPLDFALWKGDSEGPGWQSPWGKGRPGWHIECSVLSSTYLGKTIDIHGGGMDLIFPHHENELAQSESLFNVTFVRHWVHNAFVRIDKEKMSKSLGNFFTLRDVFLKYDPMVVRFMMLQHQYRSPLDFSFIELDASQKAYQRICLLFENVSSQIPGETDHIAHLMLKALCDDLNMPAAWGLFFEHWKMLQEDEQQRSAVKYVLQDILGLTLKPIIEIITITSEIQSLIDEREHARIAKDWAKADMIRDQLKSLGYEIKDAKLKQQE